MIDQRTAGQKEKTAQLIKNELREGVYDSLFYELKRPDSFLECVSADRVFTNNVLYHHIVFVRFKDDFRKILCVLDLANWKMSLDVDHPRKKFCPEPGTLPISVFIAVAVKLNCK